VLASARLRKFAWKEGEVFTADLFLLNDGPGAVPAGCIEAWLCLGGQESLLLRWDHGGTSPGRNLAGPTVRSVLPTAVADHLRVELRVPGKPEWSSSYFLVYRSTVPVAASATRPLNA
jgi:hypothetical protein